MGEQPDIRLTCPEIQEIIQKKISKEVALEYVYRAPILFGYDDFDEDNRSDFLLSLHAELPRILQTYDPAKSKFLTYLVSLVRMLARGWRRKTAKARAAEDSLLYCYRLENEPIFLSENAPEYSIVDVKTATSFLRHTEETLLVLSLKAAYTISENQIRVIASIADFDKEKLTGLIDSIKINLEKKEDRRTHLAECRNKAFFLKTKYRMELERMYPGTSQYFNVQKQYLYQSRVVETKNKLLRRKFLLVPSNSHIGKLLNISPRRVSRLIEYAARSMAVKEDRQIAVGGV